MRWWMCVVVGLGSILYCEFFADYVTLLQCSWPPSPSSNDANDELRAMVLADTHLLGPLRGHWLDKIYREWHMHRTFQTATTLLRPEMIFVLGDLFDEGDVVNHDQFREYVQRFHQHFHTRSGVPIVSAVGNHDVGFHYRMHPFFTERFEEQFNNTGVSLYTFKGNHFVFVNSMAMENDGCYFCDAALRELKEISLKLDCLKNAHKCSDEKVIAEHKSYTRPIIMQHFPTYRISDKVCKEHDSPVVQKYRENWDVLSKESTDLLGKLLQPRLAFAGHSHHYCLNINRWGIEEYTVASFSWRNKINPSFLLATITTSNSTVSKCNMLHQQTVFNVYLAAVLTCLSMLSWHLFKTIRKSKVGKTCEEVSKHK